MSKNKKPILLVALFLAYVLMPNIALALEVDYPAIRLPGGVFDLNSAFEAGKLTIESLVIYVYALFLILAGIIMFISLTRAAFVFIYSGGNPAKRAEAKKRFFSVLVGLLILVFSFTFLNIINPNIARINEPLFSNNEDMGSAFSFGGTDAPAVSDSGTFSCLWNGSSCTLIEPTNCKTGFTAIGSCEEIPEEDICNSSEKYTCNLI